MMFVFNHEIIPINNITSLIKFKETGDPIFDEHNINHNNDIEGIKLIIPLLININRLLVCL